MNENAGLPSLRFCFFIVFLVVVHSATTRNIEPTSIFSRFRKILYLRNR